MTDSLLCGCMNCVEARMPDNLGAILGPTFPGWRYACEICGNKRCPHHSNHKFACTASNAVGQPGSRWT